MKLDILLGDSFLIFPYSPGIRINKPHHLKQVSHTFGTQTLTNLLTEDSNIVILFQSCRVHVKSL